MRTVKTGLILLVLLVPLVAQARDHRVEVFDTRQGSTFEIVARNNQTCDVTITLRGELENTRSEPALPATFTLPGHTRRVLATLQPVVPHRRWHYHWRYHWEPGLVDAHPDPSVVYRLPWRSGERHVVLQGFHGAFSHHGDEEYAVDFKMPVGTRVCAARDGLVVATEDSFTGAGVTDYWLNRANYVRIRQADGTYADYLHLRPGGVSVHVGQRVAAGDPIGWSGNTGYTTEPHLHFMVYRAASGYHRESFPIRFRVAGPSAPVTPEQGAVYAAP